MEIREYLDLIIIGQHRVKSEISVLINEIIKGENLNVLIRAPSGYGKTYLARSTINFIRNTTGLSQEVYYLCDEVTKIKEDQRIHILDEVHLIKDPEYLYPLMDSRNYTFFLLTNEYSGLKEPLSNRCFPLIYSRYSELELGTIVNLFFERKKIYLRPKMIKRIVNSSKKSPREILNLCRRLYFWFRQNEIPRDEDQLGMIIQEVFGISEGGFTELDFSYLDLLKRGPLSLNTIVSSLNVPKDIVLREIEPFLLEKSLIKITSRGRSLI